MTVHIDRVTLRLAGVTQDDARRLAALVGRGLGTVNWRAGQLPAAGLTLDGHPGEPVEATAHRIVLRMSAGDGSAS